MARVQKFSISAGLLLALASTAPAQVQNETYKLIAGDAARNDNAGRNVSLHDGYVVMSVVYDDDTGTNSGSAIVFDALTGIELHKLLAPDGSAGDGFSWSVSKHSGVVVIGSNADDDLGDSSGSAHVFDAASGGYSYKLTAPDGTVQDFFDVSAFLSAFSSGDPVADFTDDGSFDFFDVSAFLTAFGEGCP